MLVSKQLLLMTLCFNTLVVFLVWLLTPCLFGCLSYEFLLVKAAAVPGFIIILSYGIEAAAVIDWFLWRSLFWGENNFIFCWFIRVWSFLFLAELGFVYAPLLVECMSWLKVKLKHPVFFCSLLSFDAFFVNVSLSSLLILNICPSLMWMFSLSFGLFESILSGVKTFILWTRSEVILLASLLNPGELSVFISWCLLNRLISKMFWSIYSISAALMDLP